MEWALQRSVFPITGDEKAETAQSTWEGYCGTNRMSEEKEAEKPLKVFQSYTSGAPNHDSTCSH